jgi:hypothetical protein
MRPEGPEGNANSGSERAESKEKAGHGGLDCVQFCIQNPVQQMRGDQGSDGQ